MKKDLIDEYAKREKISKIRARYEVELLLNFLKESILKDKKIKIKKVGTFKILEKKPRKIANPVTKKPMMIYPQPTIKFICAKQRNENLEKNLIKNKKSKKEE